MSDSTMTTGMVPSQASFRLNDLPSELQYEIVKDARDDGWGHQTVLNIACVNSHFKELATRSMNEFIVDEVADVDGSKFQGFIRSVVSNDTRARHIRRLHLTTNWHEHAYHHSWAKYATDAESLADHFGMWAMEYMTGLKELLVSYPLDLTFLGNGLAPNLKTLIVRPEGLPGFRSKRESRDPVVLAGTVNAYFLDAALRSKSLKTLDLGAETVLNENVLVLTEDLPFKESPIENLYLNVGNFSNNALLLLLQAPRGLRSFEFSSPAFEDINYPDTVKQWSNALDTTGLPHMSIFEAGLSSQTSTLEYLTIHRADAHWIPDLNYQIGSLAAFTALRHIDMDCTALLGWDHCEHLHSSTQTDALPPSSLQTLLPPNIEFLILRFEDYHSARESGMGYVAAMIHELKLASHKHLSKLRTVTFELWNTFHYCLDCEGDVVNWRHVICASQARWLRRLARDARFEFKLITTAEWDDGKAEQDKERDGESMDVQVGSDDGEVAEGLVRSHLN